MFFIVLVALAQAAGAQDETDRANAECLACHDSAKFAAPLPGGKPNPLLVRRAEFANSVHGHASLACTDCHAAITGTPHKLPPPTPALRAQQRLEMNKACTDCHAKAMRGYAETQHGKLALMGFADTATCADCHGAHNILPAHVAASTMSSGNIVKTCQSCHPDATQGFATFQSHATTDDFAHYPLMWIASKFVLAAVGGVLVIFWIHSVLWFWREFRDRQQRKPRPHMAAGAVPQGGERFVQRWTPMWRWAHLVFAVSILLLVATGITLHYPRTGWAPVLERLMGGPEVAALIHRVSAVVMVGIFVAHIVYSLVHIARNWSTFKVFGPYSLMPNSQDARDIAAMMRWFFGRGPRPALDHWNYQQKVDYWAPFWGITLLVGTGAVLWFKSLAGAFLPGWVFNLSTVIHGDEAVLAAAYLFSVHYFVSHWRPDKFPLDPVMFTGVIPLDEFKREYGAEYERLECSGELARLLVDAPSRPLSVGSMVLGLVLVLVGLALLVMMGIGVFT